MFRLKLARYQYNSLAEGPRSSTTLWLSGCSLRCRGCFNPELWSGVIGKFYTPWQVFQLVRQGTQKGDTGVAFVGGEPLEQPWGLLVTLLIIKLLLPSIIITVYSGYTLEHLLQRPIHRAVLWLADFLVDGPFIQSQAHPQFNYRGSANQRIIRLKASRHTRWRKLVFAHKDWDKLVAVTTRALSGPPALMHTFGKGTHAQDCGRYAA